MNKRLYSYDNLKFLLIFLVVFAHFLEISAPFRGKNELYFFIYSFHMPVFVYIMGLFATYKGLKNHVRKLLKYVLIYIVFQILHIYFLNGFQGFSLDMLQFTTPVWTMWYLFVMIVYLAVSPVFLSLNLFFQVLLLLASVIAALLIGKANSIGYYLSLSRLFVFLPFFLLGCMLNPYKKKVREFFISFKIRWLLAVLAFFSFCFIVVINMNLIRRGYPAHIFYGSYCYEVLGYGISVRTMQFILGVLWIYLFEILGNCIDFRLPVLSRIGENSFPVFLLHSFVVKYIDRHFWLGIGGSISFVLIVIFTVLILLCFGNEKLNQIVSLNFFNSAVHKSN